MTTTDRSRLGRANRDKGARAERALVTWLRAHGWPHAERAIATGHRSSVRERQDLGDITGTPGIAWQVTDRGDLDQPAVFARRLADTNAQRDAGRFDYGVLVQRRRGVADPARWWVWLHLGDLVALGHGEEDPAHWRSMVAPTRMELADLAPLLRAAGYGIEPPTTSLENDHVV